MNEGLVGEVMARVVSLVGAQRHRAPGAFITSWPSLQVASSWTPHHELKLTIALVLTQEPMTDTGAVEEDRFEIDVIANRFDEAREIVYFQTRRTIPGGPLDDETWSRLAADLNAFVDERWRG